MNDADEMKRLLRSAMPPVNPGLERDLWPLMLRRLDRRDSPALRRISWVDWALALGLLVRFWLSPNAIPILLFHI